jgi:hypothetical protein
LSEKIEVVLFCFLAVDLEEEDIVSAVRHTVGIQEKA